MLGLSGFAYFLFVIIVAMEGRRRTIGFGWPFLLGTIFTPIISLVLVLFSDRLPQGEVKWGCFWPVVIMVLLAILAIPLMILFGAGIMAAIAVLVDGSNALINI